MIIEVLYSDISYDFVIGQIVSDETHSYVCIYVPDLCKGKDWMASLDTFYIHEDDLKSECIMYIKRDSIEFCKLAHLLPIIGNAKAIWHLIHMNEHTLKMTCYEKNVRHLLEFMGAIYGKHVHWCCNNASVVPKAYSENTLVYAKKVLDILSINVVYSNIEYIDARYTHNFSCFREPPVQTRFFKILRHF